MVEYTSVRQKSTAFLQNFHRLTDSLNAAVLDQLYAQDAIMQFNNQEIKGFEAIRGFFEGQFSMLHSMKHTVIHFVSFVETVEDTIYQAADITYVIKGDPEAVPILVHGMANFFRKPAGVEEAGKIARFEVYLDSLPIVKRIEEVAALKAK